MTTQTTDQGLLLPSLTDAANVPTSFANLDSGGTTGGMESRLVKRYLSSADRTTRNAAPNEGELSYLVDVNRHEWYTGASWAPIPGQLVSWGSRATNSTTTTTTEIGVLRVDSIPAISGIGYMVWSTPLAGDSTVTTDEIGMRARFDTTGAAATTASAIMPGTTLEYRQADANVSEERVFSTLYVPGANQTLSILLTVRRIAGTGNVSILGTANIPTAMFVTAAGTAPADTGVAI